MSSGGTDKNFKYNSIPSIYFGGCAFGAAFYIGVYKSMWDLWGPDYFENTLVGGDSCGSIFAIAIGLRKPPEYLLEMYKRIAQYSRANGPFMAASVALEKEVRLLLSDPFAYKILEGRIFLGTTAFFARHRWHLSWRDNDDLIECAQGSFNIPFYCVRNPHVKRTVVLDGAYSFAGTDLPHGDRTLYIGIDPHAEVTRLFTNSEMFFPPNPEQLQNIHDTGIVAFEEWNKTRIMSVKLVKMVSNLFDSLLSMLLMSIQRGLSSSSASSWGIMSSSSSSNVIISGNTNITDWTFTASNPIYSTIALDSIDNSYVVDEEGGLYKLNVNGILQWKVQVGKSISPPAIFKDNIFISSTDNNIYSLSTNHGKLSWQFDSQSPVYGSPVVDNNMNIYIASQSVFSLSSTGDVQWTTTPTTIPDAFSVGTPALSPTQQSMYVAFSDGNLYALSTGAGSILWTAPVSTDKSIVSTPIVDEDGTIFIVVSGQAVYAYWPNGSLKFSVNLPTRASVAYYENGRTFYAGGLDNVMYAVSSVDGLKSWLSSSSSPFDSTPAVGPDGSVFASGTDGLLHAYSASGNLMWSYNTGNIPSPNSNIYLTSGPVIRSDGVVIVGSSNGNVYAIGYPYQPTSDAVSSSLPPLLTGTNAIVFGTVFSSTFVLAFLVFYTYRLCKRRRGIFFIDGKFRGGRRSIILNPLRLRKPIISNISVPSVSKMSPRSHYKRAAASSPSPPKSAVSDQFGGAFSVDMSVAFSPSRQLKYDSTVVIDNGASCMRAGFSADEFPESIFPSVVTIDQSANQVAEKGVNSYYVGQKAIDQLKFSHPYERGLISSWEDMEAVWEYCFSHCLEVDTNSTKVFLTEAHMPPKLQRETTVETMFELFNVDATFLHVQPVLALFAAGLTSGVVIDSGEHSTTVYPVADGYHVVNASRKLNFGGFQMNKILSHLLQENTNNSLHVQAVLSNTSSTGVVSTIKEILTSVRGKSELSTTGNIKYTLPDGSQIELNASGFTECTERFFDPSRFAHIVDGDEPSLQASVLKSIMSAPVDVRRNLASAVVLTGGNTMFKGLPERLSAELKACMPGTMSSSLRVMAPSDRCNAIWVGGSILTSLSTFEDRWITGADYDEYGPSIVHKKCSVYL